MPTSHWNVGKLYALYGSPGLSRVTPRYLCPGMGLKRLKNIRHIKLNVYFSPRTRCNRTNYSPEHWPVKNFLTVGHVRQSYQKGILYSWCVKRTRAHLWAVLLCHSLSDFISSEIVLKFQLYKILLGALAKLNVVFSTQFHFVMLRVLESPNHIQNAAIQNIPDKVMLSNLVLRFTISVFLFSQKRTRECHIGVHQRAAWTGIVRETPT